MKLALAAFVLGIAGCSHPTQVVRAPGAPAWLLADAQRDARALGDVHPQKIELFAGPNFKIRLWGRFTCGACSHGPSAGPITGGVAVYVYRGHTHLVTDFSLSPRDVVELADRVAPVRREWLATIARQARRVPDERFPDPPDAVFRARLARAARTYGFTVRSVVLHRPRGLAPEVTVESADEHRLAHALGPIIDAIDPARPRGTNARAYEGIYVVAVDTRRLPYAIAFDSLRGHVGGGQWARDESLYPFAHG